jgi:hypothetical protein
MERTVRTRRVFRGRLLGLDVVEVDLGGGRRSTREIVRHPGAVVVLPRLSDGRFVFVRQYRKAVKRTMLEAPAGTRERGETARACALREVREETGFAARRLTKMGLVIPAPGYTDEILHAYCADLCGTGPLTPALSLGGRGRANAKALSLGGKANAGNLPLGRRANAESLSLGGKRGISYALSLEGRGRGEGGPQPDQDENLEVVALSASAVESAIRRGEIQDAKTLAVWTLWRAGTRARDAREGEGRGSWRGLILHRP